MRCIADLSVVTGEAAVHAQTLACAVSLTRSTILTYNQVSYSFFAVLSVNSVIIPFYALSTQTPAYNVIPLHAYTGYPSRMANILGCHTIGHSKQKILYVHVS
jgi:hypothetical protein